MINHKMDSSNLNNDSIMTTSLITLTLFLTVLIYFRNKNRFKYFEKFGLPTPSTVPFFGNLHHYMLANPTVKRRQWRKELGRCYGFFWNDQPKFVIGDVDILQRICVKDFEIFPNRSLNMFSNTYQDQMLLNLKDDKWRRVRALTSPTFTSIKMRTMFDLLQACSNDFVAICQDLIETNKTIINAREISNNYTMDAIASCCFGIKFAGGDKEVDYDSNKLAYSKENFVREAKLVIRLDGWRMLVASLAPKWIVKLAGFRIHPDEYYDPLVARTEKIIKSRRQSSLKMNDYMQSLLDARIEDENEDYSEQNLNKNDLQDIKYYHGASLNDEEVLCAAILFLFVGMETTGNLMASTIYCLAFHQEVQQTLYDEIKSIAKQDENDNMRFDYDDLLAAKYLDAVICETMRHIPPSGCMDRVANRDYYIEQLNVTIPKGTIIDLPYDSILMDADYWPEAEEFKPERFLPENRDNIVPGSFCPFGYGPRYCVGKNFALTDAKLGLAKLLMRFRFEPAPGFSFPPELSGHVVLTWLKNPIVKILPRAT